MSSILISAFLGAMATGLLKIILDWLDRRRNREAALTAIASEVLTICRLVRHRKYLEYFEASEAEILQETWTGASPIIDIRSNYFTVFEALAHELGHLSPSDASKIVAFYAYCRSAIDSTRLDGIAGVDVSLADAQEGIIGTTALLRAILALGDQIVILPKACLTEALA